MALPIPNYIRATEIVEAPLRHRWSAKIKDDIQLDQPQMNERLGSIADRALLAFCLGSLEWTVWRFSKHLKGPELFQLLEAAWAGTIYWKYLKSFDCPPWIEDLPDPVGGPLGAGFDMLREAFIAARDDQPFSEFGASISELGLRVVPAVDPYKAWRRFVIQRLTETHSRTVGDNLGEPVPREALDPKFAYTSEKGPILIQQFLRTLKPDQNPYLRSAQELKASGFKGTPYPK